MWLSQRLESCDFGAESISNVLGAAVFELGLDIETARRYLIKQTAIWGKFRSDGHVITLRG
jgi:hypothetical protein